MYCLAYQRVSVEQVRRQTLLFCDIEMRITWLWRFEPIFEYDIADILPNNRYFIRLLLVHSLPAPSELRCLPRIFTSD